MTSKPKLRVVALILLPLLVLAACATSPTGRRQIIVLPEEQVDSMGLAAFEELKQSTRQLRDPARVDYARCVAETILRSMDDEDLSRWEVVVFDDEQVNAFALPGGRIGIYRGLLDTAENQHQLATVVGHEIAHVRARHANERVSTGMLAEGGLQVVQVLAGDPSPRKSQLFAALGLGTQVGILLPFSRAQESEADALGLEFMARAGFDPRESIPLWENMQKGSGSKPPEFLSTHPAGDTRIRALGAQMPGALAIYEQARRSGRRPACG
ncbi:MAG: M48 family metallopeptidase [Gammaproteobacteria bacterium]|nr:M48 family metallopeptidase [Gammaproteobacteria bacterium]